MNYVVAVPKGPKPYKFIGFGAIHGPKPCMFIGFGAIHGPKTNKCIGFGVPGSPFCIYIVKNGHLKAIWPDVLGCVFEVWPAPGTREGLQKRWGGEALTFWAPGAGQTSKTQPQNSGQTAFRYPEPSDHEGRASRTAETRDPGPTYC